MKKISLLVLAGLCVTMACETGGNPRTQGTVTTTDTDNTSIGLTNLSLDAAALQHGNLTIYPIIAKNAEQCKYRFTTLEEGLKNGTVIISEQGETPTSAVDMRNINRGRIPSDRTRNIPEEEMAMGGAVNTLVLHNTGKDTLFIMAGDVIGGGRQDRVIAQDMLIAPGKSASPGTPIPVFCVEPHRWNYEEGHGADNTEGKFAFYGHTVACNVRSAVVNEQNQGRVWEEVGTITAANKSSTSTGTYNALNDNKTFTNSREDYLNFFAHQFDSKSNVVGVVVVNGDHITGCDIFGCNGLFRQRYESLLHGYIADAISFNKAGKVSETQVNAYFTTCRNEFNESIRKNSDAQRKLMKNGDVLHYTKM